MLILFEQPQPVRRPSAAAATTTSKTRPLVVATAAAAGATVAAPLSGYVAATSNTISCVFLGGADLASYAPPFIVNSDRGRIRSYVCFQQHPSVLPPPYPRRRASRPAAPATAPVSSKPVRAAKAQQAQQEEFDFLDMTTTTPAGVYYFCVCARAFACA